MKLGERLQKSWDNKECLTKGCKNKDLHEMELELLEGYYNYYLCTEHRDEYHSRIMGG